MPRARMIKPEFWSDEKVGELSYMERLLFIGMWNFADDEGLIKAHPSFLKANIFPYDDNLKPDQIEKALATFETKGMIYRYVNNNQKYLWIIKFRIYQRIDKPQKPNNPLPSIQNSNFGKAIFKRDNFICHICKIEVDPSAPLNESGSSTPSLDHIVPQSKDGTHAPSNLATACISCNKKRGNKDIITFQEDSKNVLGTLIDEVNRSKEKLKEKKENARASFVFILPDDIDPETWNAFTEMRSQIKKPLTEWAKHLICLELDKIGQDKNAVLNKSIKNNWQDVYPLDQEGTGTNGRQTTIQSQENPIDHYKRVNGL